MFRYQEFVAINGDGVTSMNSHPFQTGNLSNKTKRGDMVTDMPCAERESLEVEVWSSMNYSRIQATADWNNNKVRVGLVPHEDRIWSSLSISMRCSQVLSGKIFILKR